MEYKKVKLSECCNSISDGDHLPPPKSQSGVPFITISNIDGDNQINFNGTMFVPDSYYDSLSEEKKARIGDILYSVVGSFGKPVFIDFDKRFVFQRHIAILKPNDKINSRYLYYVMLNPDFYYIADKMAIGAAQRTITLNSLRNTTVNLHDIAMQNAIVDVLSCIDKKIQCNNKINDNLQHQLKLLYDYWFTQFDFPDENGKPYRASGGTMVWCDALHQNIPVNWNISSLGEICSFKNGINYEKDEIGNKQYKIVNVRNITASQMLLDPNSFDTITLSDKKADKYLIEANDFLIARSGSPGATRLLIPSTIPTIYCGFIICCSTSCELKNYIALTLKKLEIANDTKSSGSILKNVSQDTLKEIMLCIPQSKVLDSFNSKANSIIQAMQVTIEENNTLTALRDWLLPMLMNGQATISD